MLMTMMMIIIITTTALLLLLALLLALYKIRFPCIRHGTHTVSGGSWDEEFSGGKGEFIL